jgi:Ca-activated chloride channel homolog
MARFGPKGKESRRKPFRRELNLYLEMKKPIPSLACFATIALAAALVLAPVSPSAVRADPLPQQQPIRVQVDLVNILANVMDHSARPVTNLPKEAFEVFDEGAQQQIAIFEPETHLPLDMALMIDASASARIAFQIEREAAAKFIKDVVHTGDGLAVFSFSDDVRQLTGFTAEVPLLQNAVRKMKEGSGTAMYDAVYLGAQRLMERKSDHRRVIVVVTDAGESSSKASFDTARREAISSGALLYTIVLRAVKGESGRNTAGEHAMETITQTTGGYVSYPSGPEQLDTIFSQINLELRTQYRLGYYPEHRPGGAIRKIEIRVKGDYDVHYRQAYIPPSEDH